MTQRMWTHTTAGSFVQQWHTVQVVEIEVKGDLRCCVCGNRASCWDMVEGIPSDYETKPISKDNSYAMEEAKTTLEHSSIDTRSLFLRNKVSITEMIHHTICLLITAVGNVLINQFFFCRKRVSLCCMSSCRWMWRDQKAHWECGRPNLKPGSLRRYVTIFSNNNEISYW